MIIFWIIEGILVILMISLVVWKIADSIKNYKKEQLAISLLNDEPYLRQLQYRGGEEWVKAAVAIIDSFSDVKDLQVWESNKGRGYYVAGWGGIWKNIKKFFPSICEYGQIDYPNKYFKTIKEAREYLESTLYSRLVNDVIESRKKEIRHQQLKED